MHGHVVLLDVRVHLLRAPVRHGREFETAGVLRHLRHRRARSALPPPQTARPGVELLEFAVERPDLPYVAAHPAQLGADVEQVRPMFLHHGTRFRRVGRHHFHADAVALPRGLQHRVRLFGQPPCVQRNSRAVAALWMAGKDSLMDDVRFLGGHGTLGPDGKRVSPYAANLASDPDPHRRWDAQYPSLWITHGGGGTFANIWTPSTFAQAGLYISDTSTPGHVYELSAEHHSRTEIKLDQAANWELYSLQTEGEREESADAMSLDISRSKNI